MATGGLTKGKSHAEGGIPMTVKDTGQNIEVEGGEIIINKKSVADNKKHTFDGEQLTKCEVASKINEDNNNGVKIDCDSVEGKKYKHEKGGKLQGQELDQVFDDYFRRGGKTNIITLKNGLGYDKNDLPQIRTESKPLFAKFLNEKFDRQMTSKDKVLASTLRPVQNKINLLQIDRIKQSGGLRAGKPITISNDGYVIDGHHRWYYAKQNGLYLPVLKIDLPAKAVIYESFNSGYAEKENINSIRGLAEGGKISKEYSTKEIPLSLYKSFFQDTDGDGVPNVDDVAPFQATDKTRLEEVSLSDEMRTIINYRNDFEDVRKDVVEDLDDIIEECDAKGDCGILSRTKTPYSIINKLRRRSLTDVKDLDKLESKAKAKIKDKDLTGIDLYKGLTDVVGTMVVAPDKKNADKVKEAVKSGRLGKVLEFEDFYDEPNNGYRAYHFLIAVEKDKKTYPIEVQVKTKRVKILGDFAHTLYKTGNLDGNAFNELNELALKGDMGDVEAQQEFDEIVSNQQKVMSMISKKSMETGGVITNTTQFNEYAKFENDAEELQESEDLFDDDLFQNPDKFQEELDVAIDNSFEMRKDYQQREYDYIKAKEKSDDKIKADKRRKAKELLKKYQKEMSFASGGVTTAIVTDPNEAMADLQSTYGFGDVYAKGGEVYDETNYFVDGRKISTKKTNISNLDTRLKPFYQNKERYKVNVTKGKGKGIEVEVYQKNFDKWRLFKTYKPTSKGGSTYAEGGEVNEAYIDYMNKDKGYKKDRKYFKTYKDAEKWARNEFESFYPDMISYTEYETPLRGFAKGGYVVEDGKVMLDGNKIGSYQFDRDSNSFWIYDGVKDRSFEEKEDIIDYFKNRNFAKGGMVSKNDEQLFIKHAQNYLKDFYDDERGANYRIEKSYLPNLKKLDDKTYQVEYDGSAGTLFRQEFRLTKKSLKDVKTFEKNLLDKNPKWEKFLYEDGGLLLTDMQYLVRSYEQGGMITGNPIDKLIPYGQLQSLKQGEKEIEQGLRDEPLFLDDLNQSYKLVPKIYTQDGKGMNAVAYFHYFYGGSDWYITEYDKDTNEGYGYAILNGDTQMSEMGYIDLAGLTEKRSGFQQINIDQYFKPQTLNQVFQRDYPELVRGEVEIYEPVKEVEVIETTDYLNMDFKNAYERNLVIRKLIEEKGDNGNNYSIDEKEFIQLYSGMGGLEKFGATEGLLYEYYTPKDIVQKMWGLAFKHKLGTQIIETCLEPSVATGNFVGYAPKDVKMIGYDIDKYAYSICNILYDNDKNDFYNMSFEKLFINNRNKSVKDKVEPFCDLVIGNPPYGKYSGLYAGMGEKKYTEANDYIDYFIFRSLDLLKSGGLLIFIIGKLTQLGGQRFTDQISKNPNKCQMAIRQKSNLVDAYRLPVGVFDTTQVESEIIVLRKK